MIDSFSFLTEEDKADVITNIDTYSLDEIEAKLSVIAVRNQVFSLKNKVEEKPQTTFSLNNGMVDEVPAWVKAIREVANENN
jgi:hypothetical protein